MKRVVIIGADFVPSSLPPALRIRFFARHLPEFGWRPTILTTDPDFYEGPVDAENERLLPESLEVIRTPALRAPLARRIGIGDIGMRSMWHHWRALSALCRREKVDLVFIPVPPYVPMILGRLAHIRFGIPYVIDYIDPWITNYYWKLPKAQRPPKWALAYALSRVLEPFALRRVGHTVGVSKQTTDGVIARYSWLSEEDTSEIPYGGEAFDFEYLRKHPRKHQVFEPDDGHLHVSYVGACLSAMYPTLRALFKAVRLGRERSPDIFNRLRMHFVGTNYASNAAHRYQVLPIAREIGVDNQVDERPERVPYLDSLQLILDSHAVLAIGSQEPHYTASKIFPYLLAQKPILAVFHRESTVVTILRETKAGTVITFDERQPVEFGAEQISKALEQILATEHCQASASWVSVDQYSTRAMTARLARSFDRVVAKRDATPLSRAQVGA